MPKLFEKFIINSLEIKNRFVLSAAFDPDIEKFKMLAEGEIGLIISGGCSLNNIESFKSCIEAVHAEGGKIILQIVIHSGIFGHEKDSDAIAVSVLSEENHFFNPFIKYIKHHSATEVEIKKIIDSFLQAAIIAKDIGADGVQLHSANKSLLSQFLSPLTNKRIDKWGGSLENRTRIHKNIYDGIRAKVGKNYPILIKLGVEDALDGGLKFQEGKKIAKMISSYGFDAIEIGQGLQDLQKAAITQDWSGTSVKNNQAKEGYYRDWCKEIKKEISTPLIMSGGLKSYELMEELLKNQESDLFGLCRPFIREPSLIKRWRNGDLHKATCISCNKCIIEHFMNPSLECSLEK